MATDSTASSGADAIDTPIMLTRRHGQETPDSSMTPHGDTQRTSKKSRWSMYFGPGGNLRPFRLLRHDMRSLKSRYISDWTLFNQQVVASAVYIFFTNILPGITFASDLYTLTGRSWGTIEIVLSTGLCGIIFAL